MKELVKLNKKELEEKYKERTLVLCKPESIITGLYPEILSRIQRFHYKTPLVKMIQFHKDSIMEFYESVIEEWKPREDIIKIFMNMTKYPTLVTVVEGPNSIKAMRKLAGGLPKYESINFNIIFKGYEAQFRPINAPMGTIRGDYSAVDIDIPDTNLIPVPNYIHASADEKDYKREIDVLLKYNHISEKDFIEYEKPEWKILFGVDL